MKSMSFLSSSVFYVMFFLSDLMWNETGTGQTCYTNSGETKSFRKCSLFQLCPFRHIQNIELNFWGPSYSMLHFVFWNIKRYPPHLYVWNNGIVNKTEKKKFFQKLVNVFKWLLIIAYDGHVQLLCIHIFDSPYIYAWQHGIALLEWSIQSSFAKAYSSHIF